MTGAPDEQAHDVTIDVLRGAPTEDELAALIAVVSEEYAGEASEAVEGVSHPTGVVHMSAALPAPKH